MKEPGGSGVDGLGLIEFGTEVLHGLVGARIGQGMKTDMKGVGVGIGKDISRGVQDFAHQRPPFIFIASIMSRQQTDESGLGAEGHHFDDGGKQLSFWIQLNDGGGILHLLQRHARGIHYRWIELDPRLKIAQAHVELLERVERHVRAHVAVAIAVAAGEKLPFAQSDVKLRGAAMELRVYAEDPDNNFFPSPGKVTHLRRPLGPGIRLDECVFEGWTVPLEYDPLLGKMIAWGNDRQEVILRLKRGLAEYAIGGIKTNLSFFRQILDHPDFLAGRLDTGLVDRMLAERRHIGEDQRERVERLAALAAVVFACSTPGRDGASRVAGRSESRWKIAGRQALLDRKPRP